MAWVSVHQSIDGAKLRAFKRASKLSKAECLGVLTALWLWALDNCDQDGVIPNATIEDVEDMITTWLNRGADVSAIVDAIVTTGWIDIDGDVLRVHDWGVWQKAWSDLLKERKRKADWIRNKRNQGKEDNPDQEQIPPDNAACSVNSSVDVDRSQIGRAHV